MPSLIVGGGIFLREASFVKRQSKRPGIQGTQGTQGTQVSYR